jgi:hypothetical protein
VLALLVMMLTPYMGRATVPGVYGSLREPPVMLAGFGAGLRVRCA